MLEELEMGLAEPLENKVDLGKQLVRAKLRAPPLEDGMGGGQHTIVDDKVVWGETVDKILNVRGLLSTTRTSTSVSQLSGKSIEAMVDSPSPIWLCSLTV